MTSLGIITTQSERTDNDRDPGDALKTVFSPHRVLAKLLCDIFARQKVVRKEDLHITHSTSNVTSIASGRRIARLALQYRRNRCDPSVLTPSALSLSASSRVPLYGRAALVIFAPSRTFDFPPRLSYPSPCWSFDILEERC